MKATFPWLGALLLAALPTCALQAQVFYSPALDRPLGHAPDATGPACAGYYCGDCYVPSYYLVPPFPPETGIGPWQDVSHLPKLPVKRWSWGGKGQASAAQDQNPPQGSRQSGPYPQQGMYPYQAAPQMGAYPPGAQMPQYPNAGPYPQQGGWQMPPAMAQGRNGIQQSGVAGVSAMQSGLQQVQMPTMQMTPQTPMFPLPIQMPQTPPTPGLQIYTPPGPMQSPVPLGMPAMPPMPGTPQMPQMPVAGAIPAGPPGIPGFPMHTYARSPRDFFMWNETNESQLNRMRLPTLVP